MSTETAKTLSLVAGILFLLQFIGGLVAGLSFYFFFPQLLAFMAPMIDAATLAMLTTVFTLLQLIIPIIIIGFCTIDLVFAILTLRWRHEPFLHKTGLIVVGVLGLVFGGMLPGILALVAGAIVEPK
jgi:hypothetical protein